MAMIKSSALEAVLEIMVDSCEKSWSFPYCVLNTISHSYNITQLVGGRPENVEHLKGN